jgi:hypothetical protein
MLDHWKEITFIKIFVTLMLVETACCYDLTQNSYTLGNGPGFGTNDASVGTGFASRPWLPPEKSLIIKTRFKLDETIITTQVILF